MSSFGASIWQARDAADQVMAGRPSHVLTDCSQMPLDGAGLLGTAGTDRPISEYRAGPPRTPLDRLDLTLWLGAKGSRVRFPPPRPTPSACPYSYWRRPLVIAVAGSGDRLGAVLKSAVPSGLEASRALGRKALSLRRSLGRGCGVVGSR